MNTISFFLEDRLISTGTAPPFFKWGTPFSHPSRAYFCPVCGQVWARISSDDNPWLFTPRRCKRHGPPFLLRYDEPEWNSAANIRVWAREFLIAMELYLSRGKTYDISLITSGC